MLALSLKQPWAWLWLSPHKWIESRNWRMGSAGMQRLSRRLVGHRLAVHASKTVDREAFDRIGLATGRDLSREVPADLPRGCIVGHVRVAEVRRLRVSDDRGVLAPCGGDVGIVREPGPVALEEPMPCRGQLGIFEVRDTGLVPNLPGGHLVRWCACGHPIWRVVVPPRCDRDYAESRPIVLLADARRPRSIVHACPGCHRHLGDGADLSEAPPHGDHGREAAQTS